MGERNFPMRYSESRKAADNEAKRYASGADVQGWRYEPAWMPGQPEPPKVTLVGAAWVAWMYQIAKENAETCVSVHGARWQKEVDECQRLVAEYQEYEDSRKYMESYYEGGE